MTRVGGGGQKSPILRRHSLWTAPKSRVGRQAKDKILIIKINFYQGYQLEQVNHPYNSLNRLNCESSATLFLNSKVFHLEEN